MKNTKRLVYILALSLVLVGICVACFIIGRGHTIYIDNKTTEDGKYNAYECIVVYQGEDKIAELFKRERGVMTVTGQKVEMTLEIQKKKNSFDYDTVDIVVDIPYSIDNVVINIPAYLEGATEEEYLTEFIPLIQDTEEDEEIDLGEDFGIGE